MSRIRLNIDKLVLRGLDPAVRHAFVASLKSELEGILAEPVPRAAWARTQCTPVVRLGRMNLEPGTTGAGKLGAQVARGISGRLRP
jgi:hypothetical protein